MLYWDEFNSELSFFLNSFESQCVLAIVSRIDRKLSSLESGETLWKIMPALKYFISDTYSTNPPGNFARARELMKKRYLILGGAFL